MEESKISKLSVHYNQSGNHTGIGDFLAKCYNAGNPVGVVYCLNGVVSSPGTKIIYRRQTDTFNRLPNNFFNDDPVANATNWINGTKDKSDQNRTQLQNWQLNSADWYDPLNEPVIEIADPSDPNQVAEAIRRAKYLNTWELTALEIAHSYGLKLVLFSFGTESGTLDSRVWNELIPCITKGKEYGAIFSLHAYGIDGGLINRTNAYKQHLNIYRLLPEEIHLPVVYSECGSGNGYNTGLSGQAYVNDLGLVDDYWRTDPKVLGGCSFQLGGNESNMVSIMGIYGDYASTHPNEDTVIEPPPPMGEPPSKSGTTVPGAKYIKDWFANIWTLGAESEHGRIVLQNKRQFEGGQAVMLLYYANEIYAINNLMQWWKVSNGGWIPVPNDPRVEPVVEHRLLVPYLSQLDGTDVDYAPGDCGPANVAMALNYFGRNVTVDQVSQATGLPAGFLFTNYDQLNTAALVFGYTVEHTINNLSEKIKSSIDSGKPVIALINYAKLPTTNKYDLNYNHGHFLLIVGYTENEVIYHDPYWHNQDGAFKRLTWEQFDLCWSTPNADFTYFRQLGNILTKPIIPNNVKAGLHMAARGGDQTLQDWQTFDNAKLQAIKFMSNHALNDIKSGISRVGASNVYFRMYGDPNDSSAMSSGTNFFNVHRGWFDQLYPLGVVNWEVHNEPNLEIEGLNRYWSNAAGFSTWFRQVASLIRANYPNAKIIYPGLSPQANVPEWKVEIQKLINEGLVDKIGAHSYWQTAGSEHWGMLNTDGGQFYKTFLNIGKPVVLTEASNNGSEDKNLKGSEYVQYLKTLNSVEAVLFFVSSTSNSAYNSEAWVESNIPQIVGAR